MTYDDLLRAKIAYGENSDSARLAKAALNVELYKGRRRTVGCVPEFILAAVRTHLETHRATIDANVDEILHHVGEIEALARAGNAAILECERATFHGTALLAAQLRRAKGSR